MQDMAQPLAICAVLPFLVAAVKFPPDWQQQLESQLLKEQTCQVNFYSDTRVRVVNGEESVFTRAHCTDKRAFDASRTGRDKPFKIEECKAESC